MSDDSNPGLTLHPAYQGILRPLKEHEQSILRSRILAEGPVFPVDVDQHGRIVDGHHTYEIYQGEGIADFPIRQHDFQSDEDAVQWILAVQLGRRNLDATDYTTLLGTIYSKTKKPHGGARRVSSVQIEHLNSSLENTAFDDIPISTPPPTGGASGHGTAEQIAEQFDTSASTVRRAEKVQKALDSLSPAVRKAIQNQTLKASNTTIRELAELSHEEQLALAAGVKAKKHKTLREALHPAPPKPQSAPVKPAAPVDRLNHLAQKIHEVSLELVAIGRDLGRHKTYYDPITDHLDLAHAGAKEWANSLKKK